MFALAGLLTIIVLSITGVRIGAIAFELTGLSPEVAAFQAQSAFSGVGFTTSEAESIVSHPVRRRTVYHHKNIRFPDVIICYGRYDTLEKPG